MPQCITCKQTLPVGFVQKTEDNQAWKCIFCKTEKNVYEYTDPNTGQGQSITKDQVIDEYKKYIDKFAEDPNIKEMIREKTVEQALEKNKVTGE